MGGDPDAMDLKYNFTHRISSEMRVFRSIRAQTVTTHVQLDKLRELYGFQGENVGVIPPGVDVHTFRPGEPEEARLDTGLPPRYILCLSRIDTNKGHDLLLYAFDIVRQAVPDVHLVIGGGSANPQATEAEVLANMRGIITDRGMGDRVTITGYVPDEHLVATYRQAEMFVLPSLFEPFGMTALEAMACARPVVASKLGGIRDVITSGESGLLVDPSDAAEFAAAMVELLKDRRQADGIGLNGRQVVLNSYSWEAIAERHIGFYKGYL
jgi:mannosylfructose-phosphate synthase